MQYVTEEELRRTYNQGRFDSYELPVDARLTPSARQFLIDFHVAFDDGDKPFCIHRSGGSSASHEEPKRVSPYGAFVEDVRVLGARLRLLGYHALGVDNDVAYACDALGAAWLRAGDLGCLLENDEPKGDEPEREPCVPTMSARVHPVFFEMAVLDAEIARAEHFWTNAEADMAECEREALGRWKGAVGVIRNQFAVAACRAEGGVRHG